MTYESTVTSKGTITIAAPLRKALDIRPGQRVKLSVDKHNNIIVDRGVLVADFEATRDRVLAKMSTHKKMLSGEALKEASEKAWAAGYSE